MFDRGDDSLRFVRTYLFFWPLDGSAEQEITSLFIFLFRSWSCGVGFRSESERLLVRVIDSDVIPLITVYCLMI